MTPVLAAVKQHLIDKIRSAAVQQIPFPYVLIEDVFPADFYATLISNLPSDAQYQRLRDTGRVAQTDSPERYCFFPEKADPHGQDAAIVRFWRELRAMLCDAELLKIWGKTFRDAIKAHAEASTAKGNMQLYNEMFLMRDREAFKLGPHRDSDTKVISVLFYLPADDRDADLGTALYALKDASMDVPPGVHADFADFDRVAKAPFRPNTLLAFPNTPLSFHGVEPVTGPHRTRDILLYDIKHRS